MNPFLAYLRRRWWLLTRPTEITIDGFRVYLGHLARDPYARAIYKGTHEAAEREVARNQVRAGDRVLEIGAGMGLVTLWLCRIAGDSNVVTCEANPEVLPILERNLSMNGYSPTLVPKIVSTDEAGREFHVASRFVSSSTYAHQQLKASASEIQRLPSASFKDLLDRHRPTVVMMDIEGGEVDLLDESLRSSSIRKICVEVHPSIVTPGRIDEMREALNRAGFRHDIEGSRGEVWLFQRV